MLATGNRALVFGRPIRRASRSTRLDQDVLAIFECSLKLIVVILRTTSLACGYERVLVCLSRGALQHASTQGTPSSIRLQLLPSVGSSNRDEAIMRKSR